MLYEKEATGSVDEVRLKVEEATMANGFSVMAVINLKGKMAAKGVEFGPECQIVEVCNPVQARKVLEANMALSTALPCRISVYEESGKVKVATIKPTAIIGLFGSHELGPVATSVEETIIRIIDTACE